MVQLIILKVVKAVIKVKSLIIASVAGLLASTGAQATYGNSNNYTAYLDMLADAGSYGPLVLGENIELDACGSNVTTSYGTDPNSICAFSDMSNFSVNWWATNLDTGISEWLTSSISSPYNATFGNAATNAVLTVATGAGSFFNSVGTYIIGLYVAGSDWVSTPSGYWGDFGGDNPYSFNDAFYNNGDLNGGTAYSSNFEITAPVVTVPEPESLFLLLPGLALMALRERRRRRKVAI
jgi:hypothetical protein